MKNIPNVKALAKLVGLSKDEAQWFLLQLGIDNSTANTASRQHPAPVAIRITGTAISGITVIGDYIALVSPGKIVYHPIRGALVSFDTDEKTLRIGDKLVFTLLDADAYGSSLGRVHEWIRNMVIDYRRT